MEVTQDLVNQIMMLYDKKYDADIFNFDVLSGPNIYQIIPSQIVEHVHQYIINPKYSSDTRKKIEYIDRILKPYGLVRFAAGTNRAVYKYMEDQSFCVKVALDKTGLTNNPDEFKNQQFLKPFVNKIFSVSLCGTFATCERVIPIRSRQEFAAVAGDIFDVIANKFIGKYLLEDIGTIWFKNWGVRGGFGPVLLDYPYLYEVNINRLFCNEMTPLGLPCGGQIDYDTGFNILYCTRCGKRHKAKQIGKAIQEKLIAYKGGNGMSFSIIVKKGDKVIVDKTRADNHISPEEVLKAKNSATRVVPTGGNFWRKEDFDLIITIHGIKFGKKDGKFIKLGESKAKAAIKTAGVKENPYRGIITNVKPKEDTQNSVAVPEWVTATDKNTDNQNSTIRKITVDMSYFNTRPSQVLRSDANGLDFGVKIIRKTPIDEVAADAEREDMVKKAQEVQKEIEQSITETQAVATSNSVPQDFAATPVEVRNEDNTDVENNTSIREELEAFHNEEFAATIKHFGLESEDFNRSVDKSQKTEDASSNENYDIPDVSDF